MQYLRTGIMKIQRRIMEKDELLPLAGAFERCFQPPDLAPEDFGVMLRAGLFVFKPAARAAQRQIFPFRRVIMQQRDGVQTVLRKKSVHFCRGRPPVVVIALNHQLFAGQTVEKLKIRQRLGKTHCPAEIAADDAGVVLMQQIKAAADLIHIADPASAEGFHGLVRFADGEMHISNGKKGHIPSLLRIKREFAQKLLPVIQQGRIKT